jgi:hypothetical protein
LTRQREYQLRQIAAGKCAQGDGKRLFKAGICSQCYETSRARVEARTEHLKSVGLCIACGKRKPATRKRGKTGRKPWAKCRTCIDKAAESFARWAVKKKALQQDPVQV